MLWIFFLLDLTLLFVLYNDGFLSIQKFWLSQFPLTFRQAQNYSCADWDGLCAYFRNVPWDDIFKLDILRLVDWSLNLFSIWSFFLLIILLWISIARCTIQPCMEYCCCHVWARTPSCFLELFDKLQKWIYKTFAPSLAVRPLLNPWLIIQM